MHTALECMANECFRHQINIYICLRYYNAFAGLLDDVPFFLKRKKYVCFSFKLSSTRNEIEIRSRKVCWSLSMDPQSLSVSFQFRYNIIDSDMEYISRKISQYSSRIKKNGIKPLVKMSVEHSQKGDRGKERHNSCWWSNFPAVLILLAFSKETHTMGTEWITHTHTLNGCWMFVCQLAKERKRFYRNIQCYTISR